MNEFLMPYGYVYRIINTVNGKTYIGQHKLSLDSSWRQYMGSGLLINQALAKYGKENFVKQFITYAFDKKSLDELETYYIINESDLGKAEYNLVNNKNLDKTYVQAHRVYNIINDEKLFSMFFDDLKTYAEIAKYFGITQASLMCYIDSKINYDEKFLKLKEAQSIRRKDYLKNYFKEISSTNLPKKQCKNCGEYISHQNFNNHYNSCVNDRFYKNCDYENCNNKVKKTSKYCRQHYLESLKESNQNKNFGDKTSLGAKKATHIRWHLKRGIKSQNCEFCDII